MAKTVIAFDLFGTILSTDSISQELAKLYGDDAASKIAPLARRYQLEYTWRCNSMGGFTHSRHFNIVVLIRVRHLRGV